MGGLRAGQVNQQYDMHSPSFIDTSASYRYAAVVLHACTRFHKLRQLMRSQLLLPNVFEIVSQCCQGSPRGEPHELYLTQQSESMLRR
jgi:hypothetical protein